MEAEGKRILTVRNLTVRFDTSERSVTAVRDLGFHVDAGEVLAIVGESGSGKSVTALSVMRLVEHGGGVIVSGSINFTGNDGIINLVTASGQVMRSVRGGAISMIFQEPMTSLNPVFPVGAQIAEAIRLHQGFSRDKARAEALRLLDLVRIPEARQVLRRYPHQLSGGMRQRVMIAMALSCKPALLIADEPTTALDVTIQAQILQLIRMLQHEMGMGVIFITHDMGVVAEMADRVLVMHQGRAVEEADVDRLFHHPQQTYTRSLLAAVPILGSMRGRDLPAPFPLLEALDPEAQAMGAPVLSNHAVGEARPGNGPDPCPPRAGADRGAEPVLSVRGMTTRFDVGSGVFGRVRRQVYAVERVDVDLYPGETLGLVGESGCGKSTLGRSILGLETPSAGSIRFAGLEIAGLTWAGIQPLRRNIQYIFQDPYASLNPRLTIGFSVMEPLLIHKICSRAEAEGRVRLLLEKVGLEPAFAARYPHEFSGGQRQRICIARALTLNPKILIADESVSALDVSVRAQIVNLLLDLQQELGLSMLFISHDMAVIERVCHRVAVMYLGQIVETGSRRAVFEHPAHPYTRTLMSAVPVPDPARRSLSQTLLTGEIPSPIRRVGDDPPKPSMLELDPGHLVAEYA
jgi:glutathione transport system ATP-binding protein